MMSKNPLKECLNSTGINYSDEQCKNLESLFHLIECDVEILASLNKEDKPRHESLSTAEHQYLKLVALTQHALIRPANKERFELENLDALDLKQVRSLCQSLGFVDELMPIKGSYPLVGFLGAMQARVEKRLEWLVKHMRSGDITDVQTIIVCSGTRALRDFESATQHSCTDETQMIRYVIEKSFPMEEFPNVKFIYSNAQAAAQDLRARTDDTALKAKEDLGDTQGQTLLLISNQPYCAYQGMSYQQIFHPTKIISVGEVASEQVSAPDFYDNITRLFYANALRYLVVDKGLNDATAKSIVADYKKEYFCESLLSRSVSQINTM